MTKDPPPSPSEPIPAPAGELVKTLALALAKLFRTH
jgi:hypothetical protein